MFQTEKIIGFDESDYEGIKEGIIIGLKDNIIDADVIWTSNGSGDSISDGIRLDEYDGNSEGFTVGISLVKHWALLTTQLLVLLILPNL